METKQTVSCAELRVGDRVIGAAGSWIVTAVYRGERAYADSYAVHMTQSDAGYDATAWYPADTTFLVARQMIDE